MVRFLSRAAVVKFSRTHCTRGLCNGSILDGVIFNNRYLKENNARKKSYSVNSKMSECNIEDTLTKVDGKVVEERKVEIKSVDVPSNRSMRRPLCFYFTQGLCEKEDDANHNAFFAHDFPNFPVRPSDVLKVKKQPFDNLLILDLEGRDEIVEFPVVWVESHTLKVTHSFHRFVRPTKLPEKKQYEVIKGKYGRWKLDRVWHDTAIKFSEVIIQFEDWLSSHNLLENGKLVKTAFVTCGNWDIKTKIWEQCGDSEMDLPLYFHEWINVKDIFYNHYNKKPSGMKYMLNHLKIPLYGNHHLGLDDSQNIARIVQRMLAHRAIFRITGRRLGVESISDVEYLVKRRVK